jgi:hypothetical protein
MLIATTLSEKKGGGGDDCCAYSGRCININTEFHKHFIITRDQRPIVSVTVSGDKSLITNYSEQNVCLMCFILDINIILTQLLLKNHMVWEQLFISIHSTFNILQLKDIALGASLNMQFL